MTTSVPHGQLSNLHATCHYCHPMDRTRAWATITSIAEGQFGLFTTAQAADAGISLAALKHALADDRVWDAADSVWALTSLDKHPYEDWAAAWMAMNLDRTVADRRIDPDVIISHGTAAMIRDLGTVNPYALTVTAAEPPQRVPETVEVTIGAIGVAGIDWDLVDGLPVATPARIIADLAATRIDGSHLGTVIEDALNSGALTRAQVAHQLGPHLHKWGYADADKAIDVFITSSYPGTHS